MRSSDGRVTFFTIATGAVAVFLVFFNPFKSVHFGLSRTSADTATTTVTVLNTPPQWTIDAQENVESSTSSPTNAGSNVVWVGTATDSNNDPYYLLICKTSSTPTANAGAAPTCGGGAGNQWAVSILTTSAVQATSTYNTTSTDASVNVWVAWICDQNTSNPACNATFKQGTGNTASPFIVNHRPIFSSFSNNGPANPGAVVTWSSNASDTDNFTGATDTVALYVCKANDFTGLACGASGTYCSSSLALSSPSCTSTIAIPTQDKTYSSFGYILDNHNFTALGGAEATNASLTINNVAPTISSSSISLLNTTGTGNLILTNPGGQTTGFRATFTATDNNSCQNASGGNEIASATINVYRSGIGQASCQTSGNFNSNNCYPANVGTSTWNYSCTQDTGACAGPNSNTVTWTCTFPLQYLTDPTDGANATDTQFFAQNWLTSVRITDDNATSSALTESSLGNEVATFLAFVLNTNSINYGGLTPGAQNDPITATTTVTTNGNTGLDTTLFGVSMCTTYPSCPVSTTSTIPVGQEKYATSSVGYASSTATALLVSPGALLSLRVPKSLLVLTPATGTTFWGIGVPSTITLAGNYTGQNTVIGVKSPAQFW